MYPPIFPTAAADAAVTALLGSSPVRFWPFGLAPQNETRPYAVHQRVYGTPENTLGCPPSQDLQGIQIDAYAKTASDAEAVADALRTAFESIGYIVALNGEDWEPATGLYRSSFTLEVWTDRASS